MIFGFRKAKNVAENAEEKKIDIDMLKPSGEHAKEQADILTGLNKIDYTSVRYRDLLFASNAIAMAILYVDEAVEDCNKHWGTVFSLLTLGHKEFDDEKSGLDKVLDEYQTKNPESKCHTYHSALTVPRNYDQTMAYAYAASIILQHISTNDEIARLVDEKRKENIRRAEAEFAEMESFDQGLFKNTTKSGKADPVKFKPRKQTYKQEHKEKSTDEEIKAAKNSDTPATTSDILTFPEL